jgi:hypothetical protein
MNYRTTAAEYAELPSHTLISCFALVLWAIALVLLFRAHAGPEHRENAGGDPIAPAYVYATSRSLVTSRFVVSL